MKALLRTLSLTLAAATVAGIAVAAPPAADKGTTKSAGAMTMTKHTGSKKHSTRRAHKKARKAMKKAAAMKAPTTKKGTP